MKQIKLFCFLVSFVVVSLCPSFAIDREALWAKLTYYPTAKETQAIALQNLGLVEEILFLSDFQRFNRAARFNGLQVLEVGAWSGKLSKEKYFDILLRFSHQIPTIVQPSYVEDTRNIIWAKAASYGRTETVPSIFELFPILSGSMAKSGDIKNNGLLNSLNQKMANAKKNYEKASSDKKNSSINLVQATINELNAQRGLGITEDGFQMLSRYCQNLIAQIQNTR